jgi:CHAT domain-containing protein/tetratricopeptide (TPR) repeat protein
MEVSAAPAASTLTVDQASERCRASVGKPMVQACVRSKMQANGGPPQKYIEGCKTTATPAVQACVTKMMASTGNSAQSETAVSATATPTKADLNAVKTEKVGFVAPPRSAADVTEILDKQKPDPAQVAKLTAQADAAPAPDLKPFDLADFYYNRAQARFTLGRLKDSIADADLAVKYGQGADYQNVLSRYEQFLSRRLREAGETRRAMEIINRQITAFAKTGQGRLFALYQAMIVAALQAGDNARADEFLARSRALLAAAKSWTTYSVYATTFTGSVEGSNARIAEARGRYPEAAESYQKAAQLYSDTIAFMPKWSSALPAGEYERLSDVELALAGRAKVKAGRAGEGEADVRRALLSRLSKNGKYHPDTASILAIFVYVLQEQGRYEDAEKLQRQVIDIYKGLGYADDSGALVSAHLFLANILGMQRRYDDAGKVYDQADAWTANWEPARRDATLNGPSRIFVSISQGNAAKALEIAQRNYEQTKARAGDSALNTIVARGFLAVALARNDKRDEAYRYFKDTIPLLINASGGGDADSGATRAAGDARVRLIVEAYFSLLSRHPDLSPGNAASETFAYSDLVRGQSVQRALQASSVRSAAQNPKLAELVRISQDTDKQLGAAIATENNLLTQPSDERDANALKEVQAQILKLQGAHAQAEKDIAQTFPEYGNLTKPVPPSPDAIQAALTDDEALVSFYFGRFDSFVWVVRKGIPVSFSRVAMNAAQLDTEVSKLREALEPKAAMISDIPAFDVKRAYALYEKLLKPVEQAWKPAKSLVVVTNGALGLLPLSLLPTAPAEITRDDDPLFASYRQVPWLARTYAVALMPSASALVTLRKLPPAKPGRSELVAFGDPLFSQEEADQAARDETKTQVADAGNVTRGVPLKRRSSPQLDGVDSADLAMLPRLPDTADELKSIALALHADPAKALHLGKDANEQMVKSMDLSGFKVLAFATHGLVPGELDGLTQPALALSAPAVAGVDGDGLLTMEEILALKLDADWVVLSACNTGAGSGAGAEAASGLGHAFFYAGTKALLVTNWSVHSESARELISDLFKRQANDPKITRSEALRQAMMALVDGPGNVGPDGKTAFAYAHPLFWAPYSIIGDGGGGEH